MRHALILSGGGADGAYEAGAAAELFKHFHYTNSPITIVSGTSVGALNAAILAQCAGRSGPPFKKIKPMLEVWRTTRQKDVYNAGRFGLASMAWRWARGRPVYDSQPLHDLVRRTLDLDSLRNSPLLLLVHATDLVMRRQVTATNTSPHLIDAVIASASLPGAFAPVWIGGNPYVDGGVIVNTPIRAAIEAGAEKVTVIYLDNERLAPRTTLAHALSDERAFIDQKKVTPIWTVQRSIETALTGALERDLRMVGLYNRLAKAGLAEGRRKIEVQVLQPDEPLGKTGSVLDFTRSRLDELLSRGRRDARNFVTP